MQWLVPILALSVLPPPTVISDTIDLVEVNHFYDQNGGAVLDQIIFWNWSPEDEDFRVVAWRLIKKQWQTPVRNWAQGGYSMTWNDQDTLRCVHAKSSRETWTQYDPELHDREFLPQHLRRGLVNEQRLRDFAPVRPADGFVHPRGQ